ncbi:MAG: beta-lactamase family protein [Fibrobacterota bacterium]|nr:beta-lactamase family protein [Fibrobacterota bacterium]
MVAGLPVMGYNFSAVDKLVTDSLASFGDSVVVLIKQDENILHHNNKGNLDSTSKIGIASASKWISGAVILRLAEKNLLKLDDSIGTYLPIFTQNGKGHITIRQCFSMTSGLYGGKNFEINPHMTLKRSVDSIATNTPMAFPAGTQFAYTGSGIQAVGRIAEVVTGKSWALVAREELLDPCGMTNTTYDDFGLNPAIAGGIRSTAQDDLRFLTMVMGNGFYRGTRVLTPASIGEMFKNQTKNTPIYYSPFPAELSGYPDGKTPRYAFGCWTMFTNAQTGLEDEIASPGYFGSYPWADRCRNIYGIVLVYNPKEGRRSHFASFMLTDLVRKEIGGCMVSGIERKAGIMPARGVGSSRFHYSDRLTRVINGRFWESPKGPSTGPAPRPSFTSFFYNNPGY